MLIDEAVKAIVDEYSNTKVVIVTCGNVGCGKSTFIKKLLEYKFNPELMVVDIDSIATMLHGGDYTRFNEELFPLYDIIKSQVIEEVLIKGKSIAIDGTNFSVGARFKHLNAAVKHNAKIIAVDFGPGSKISLNRRKAEPRGYDPGKWVAIFKNMKVWYCAPEMSEGFHQIFRVEND